MRRQKNCSRWFVLLLFAVRARVTTAAAATTNTAPTNKHADPVDNVDWDSFNFGLNGVETDMMWMNRAPVDASGQASYSTESLQPLGTLNLSPAATVLNYGQSLFEGLKAFRRADGTIAMFRPEKNAARMQQVGMIYCMDDLIYACWPTRTSVSCNCAHLTDCLFFFLLKSRVPKDFSCLPFRPRHFSKRLKRWYAEMQNGYLPTKRVLSICDPFSWVLEPGSASNPVSNRRF
jgi:hypothetical protein